MKLSPITPLLVAAQAHAAHPIDGDKVESHRREHR